MIKHVEFKNKWGKTLRGYIDIPTEFNGELIVFFHGFTGNKTEHAGHFHNFSKVLSDNCFGSLRMDFSGNGESDGTFADFTIDTMLDEAKQMVQYAFDYPLVTKVTLLGFSMGGAVATALSGIYGNKISKIILWSAAYNIVDIIKRCFENGVKLENGNSLHGYFEISKEMYESLDKFNPQKGIDKFTNPVLLIHGHEDLSVHYLYSMRYSVLYYNSLVHIINGAGHGYDKVNERDELYSKSLKFLLDNRK